MEPAFLGLVLDSSILIAAERKKHTTPEAIRKVREAAGNVTIVICSLTVANSLTESIAHRPRKLSRGSARSRPRKESPFRWLISSWELARSNLAMRSALETSVISTASPAYPKTHHPSPGQANLRPRRRRCQNVRTGVSRKRMRRKDR